MILFENKYSENMDVKSNQNHGSAEGNDDLADADEPEPDNSDKSNEKRKGRFIIEDLVEGGIYDADNTIGLNFHKSYQKSKFEFFHREIIEENWQVYNDFNNAEKLAFVYNNNTQNFIDIRKILKEDKRLNLDFSFLIKFTDMCKQEVKRKDIFSEDDLENDNAIIAEEPLENEFDNNIEEKPIINLHSMRDEVSEEEEYKFSKIPKKMSVNTIRYSFDIDLNQKIKFPYISPIGSPKNMRILRNGNLDYKDLQLSCKTKKVKMMIKTIEESFNLDNESTPYKTSTGTFFRNKRLFSVDNKPEPTKKYDIFKLDKEFPVEEEGKNNMEQYNKENFQITSTSHSQLQKNNINKLSIEQINSISFLSLNLKNKNEKNSTEVCRNCLSMVNCDNVKK